MKNKMTLVLLLCFSDLLLILRLANASRSTLELSVGLSFSVGSSFNQSAGIPLPFSNATMFTVAIAAFNEAWFLPILSSPSFNSSNSSQSPGFSFGFFFNSSDNGIYLAVCGGLSGNFKNLSQGLLSEAQLAGINDSYYLFVPSVNTGYAVPVWIANPNTPLMSYNAPLVVEEAAENTQAGGPTKQLQLKDLDGRVLWKVSNVGLMEIQDTGSLTIYESRNRTNVVWQIPPRDTLFLLEKLSVGNQLTSRDSSYSARMEKGGLVLSLNTLEFMDERPASYWVIPALLSADDNPFNVSNKVMQSSPCSPNFTAYAMLDGNLNLVLPPGPCSSLLQFSFPLNDSCRRNDRLPLNVDPCIDTLMQIAGPLNAGGSGPLSFVKLENDGLLHTYAVPLDLGNQPLGPLRNSIRESFTNGATFDRPILQISLWHSCVVPNVCGPLAVCSPNAISLCTCPPADPTSGQATSAFRYIDSGDVYKGCTRAKQLPNCTKDEHVNTTDFLQLNHTASIFLFSGWLFNSTSAKVDTCMTLCSSNCSCNGFFYQANNSACFFITDEMSLLNLTNDYIPNATNIFDWQVDILRRNYVTYLKKVKAETVQPSGLINSSSAGLARSTVIAIAVASSFAACVVLGLAMLLLHSRANKRRILNKQARQAAMEEEELREVLPLLPSRFSYEDLHEATEGFSKLLGAGGCGSVYAGMLQDGRKVAVKTLEFGVIGQSKQFLAEVATIGQTSHHNIVRLVGFCWEVSSRLLVYEYMERGSLDHWLFHKRAVGTHDACDDGGAAPLLDWQTRYHVVLGIARGLSYLHEECPQPILHFDIKPQNILLDGAFMAKLADFGMSRMMQRDVSEVVTGVRGTPGYIAPEWLSHGVVSKKCDIYSMGMVMLEMVGGRKNVDLELLNNADLDGEQHESWHFPSWAARKCEQGLEMELVDKRLQGAFNEEEARRLIYTAFWCIQEDAGMRPYVPTVLQWLQGSSPVKQPPFSRAAQYSSSKPKPSSSSSSSHRLASLAYTGSARYHVSLIDDHTRKVWVYFMKQKSEVLTYFKNFRSMIEKKTGLHIKQMEGESISPMSSVVTCRKTGCRCRYTVQQNGIAERKSRHIEKLVRALMYERNLPHYYWAKAVSTIVYIMNKTPTTVVHGVTLEEKFIGRKPVLSHT